MESSELENLAVPGPSGIKAKSSTNVHEPRRWTSSCSSSAGRNNASSSSSSTDTFYKGKRHRRRNRKKRRGKHNRKDDFLHKLSNEVKELREQICDSDKIYSHSQPAITPYSAEALILDDDDRVSL